MASVSGSAATIVAIIAGDTSAMDDAANGIRDNAVRIAAEHRLTGRFIRGLSVVVARGLSGSGRRVNDRLVVSDDPASLSIEYGHFAHRKDGTKTRVPGQFIMTKAMRGGK